MFEPKLNNDDYLIKIIENNLEVIERIDELPSNEPFNRSIHQLLIDNTFLVSRSVELGKLLKRGNFLNRFSLLTGTLNLALMAYWLITIFP